MKLSASHPDDEEVEFFSFDCFDLNLYMNKLDFNVLTVEYNFGYWYNRLLYCETFEEKK